MVNVPRLQSKFQLELDQISLLQNNKLSLEALIQVWNVCIKALAEHLAGSFFFFKSEEIKLLDVENSKFITTKDIRTSNYWTKTFWSVTDS